MVQIQSPDGHIPFFDASRWESDPKIQEKVQQQLQQNDIQPALITAFELPNGDAFKYWAHMPVTLAEMQHVVNLGDVNGLHHWYKAGPATTSGPVNVETTVNDDYEKPSRRDIDAYIATFSPSSNPFSALRALEEEGKAYSIRKHVGSYLRSRRFLDAQFFKVPKHRQPHWNPALDFWAWYCRCAEWMGPTRMEKLRNVNHPALPVLMHHFGCVAPTWEAAEILRILSERLPGRRRIIYEIGSGNGYWAYILRRHGLDVRAIDNGQSVFRTNWIKDTINTDAIKYLASEKGAKDGILLMVYPVVSGDFTRKVLGAFTGDDIVVAGTQNGNRYTGFKDQTMDEYMDANKQDWTRLAQVPLPSFPGKDEAMFVYSRDSSISNGVEPSTEAVEPVTEGRNAKANARKKARKKAAKAALQDGQDVVQDGAETAV